MKHFKNILVGVDLSHGDRLVSSELPPPTVEAIERATWLAKINSARLRFFYALDISVAAQHLIETSPDGAQKLLGQARAILDGLVERAAAAGIHADSTVQFGKSWLEMIRLVLRDDHDLVVAGTRHLGAIRGLLFGSTGIKLLRLCPCPVWITMPQPQQPIQSILVAHCLRPVGDLALQLAGEMAELNGAQLHVVHALAAEDWDDTQPALAANAIATQRQTEAQQRIESQLKPFTFARPPRIHIVAESPDEAILQSIETWKIELLVMGTVARTGIAGFFTGNTAERLLPQIPCSVLAVKPAEFVSPVLPQ